MRKALIVAIVFSITLPLLANNSTHRPGKDEVQFNIPEYRDPGNRTESYELYLADAFGDGWCWDGACNTLDLSVNGTVVLDDVTLDDGDNVSFYFDVEDWDEIIHDGRPAEFRGLVPDGSGMVEIEYKDTKGHAEITQVDSWEIETEWMEESGYYKNPDRDEIDSGIGKKAMGSMGKAHDDKVKTARKKKAADRDSADRARLDRMASTGEGGWYKVGKKKKK